MIKRHYCLQRSSEVEMMSSRHRSTRVLAWVLFAIIVVAIAYFFSETPGCKPIPPTATPTHVPTKVPTNTPTKIPTHVPTNTLVPTNTPTAIISPTLTPTKKPTPTRVPTVVPTEKSRTCYNPFWKAWYESPPSCLGWTNPNVRPIVPERH